MENINEWGSVRRVTMLTPNIFLRKIMVISTTFSVYDNRGETAIGQINSLNHLTLDLREVKFKKIEE